MGVEVFLIWSNPNTTTPEWERRGGLQGLAGARRRLNADMDTESHVPHGQNTPPG